MKDSKNDPAKKAKKKSKSSIAKREKKLFTSPDVSSKKSVKSVSGQATAINNTQQSQSTAEVDPPAKPKETLFNAKPIPKLQTQRVYPL